MCYAIPGKIIELKNNIAVLDYYGEHRNVLNQLSGAKVGDYAYAQGGILLDLVPKKQAQEILVFWKDKFLELKEIDKERSKISPIKASENILNILQKVNNSKELTNEELLTILNTKNQDELKLIYQTANNQRQRYHDNACCVHGIIEFSNYCKNDCFYCGIRKSRKINRYRISPKEIIEIAKEAVKKFGFKALVLQSGEDPYYTDEILVQIITELRKLGILIFLSIGIRKKSSYDKFYKAGARAVLLRFETSNKTLFNKLRPNTNFEERIGLIKYLKKTGWLISTGFIIGLPKETKIDLINNIKLTKELKSDMYSFGPFIPCKNTPLEKILQPNKDIILKTIALTRFIDKNSKILVTTALETVDSNAKRDGLLSGANSLMINVTPKKFKVNYEIYPRRPDKNKSIQNNINETIELLYSLGRAPTDLGI